MPIEIFPNDTDSLPSLHLGNSTGFQVDRYRWHSGKQAGCELLVVRSPSICAMICPTRGMSLWKAQLGSVACQWESPVHGPIHPGLVPLSDPSGLGWLDGFDELLVRCGLRSFGAPDFDANGRLLFPLHGSIGNIPAENVSIQLSDDQESLTVSGDVYETRFLLYSLRLRVQYQFDLNSPHIRIRDSVKNVGGNPITMQLLYHINLGKPLLDASCEFQMAARQIVARDSRAAEDLSSWNEYLGPTEGYAEQVYFAQPIADSTGWVSTMLRNSKSEQAICVSYRNDTLPHFSLWKNTASEATGYVTGLEPGTGYPNPRSFEDSHGRVVELKAGESRQFELILKGLSGENQIQGLIQQLDQLQGDSVPQLLASHADWCQA